MSTRWVGIPAFFPSTSSIEQKFKHQEANLYEFNEFTDVFHLSQVFQVISPDFPGISAPDFPGISLDFPVISPDIPRISSIF
jgi:hypothetical protein